MMIIGNLAAAFPAYFPEQKDMTPWYVTGNLVGIINELIEKLDDDYVITNAVAIHKTAVVEDGVVLKAPVIVGAHCFIGAHAYLRGGVFLAKSVSIGTGCEIKSSIILEKTGIAHFNFIGDSIIGSDVNFEAGSITANHFNERPEKNIPVMYASQLINTGSIKFGSLVGDGCRIGANAVLSPGTILLPATVVKRLELVEQLK